MIELGKKAEELLKRKDLSHAERKAISGVLSIARGWDGENRLGAQTLSLGQATKEYKNKLTDPELLTQFMSAFWQKAGQRIGMDIVVDKFPLTDKEIKEKQKNGQMAIFVPAEVSRVDLGKMFPKMESWAVKEENTVVSVVNNSGWLWIEASVDVPNRGTTQSQLEKKLRKEKRQGQSLRTYIVGSQISKSLTDKYFDEGAAWSRLLGSRDEGGFLSAIFDSNGYLSAYSYWRPEYHHGSIGGRSEEVIKA